MLMPRVQEQMKIVNAREENKKEAEDKERLESTGSTQAVDYVLKMVLILGPKFLSNPTQVQLRVWVDRECKAADEHKEGEFHRMGIDTEGSKDKKAHYVQIAGPFSPCL